MQNTFIEKVFLGLKKCEVSISDSIKIGIAVSGGADSVSLLFAMMEIFKKENIFVLTVNHNIRSENETKGDADFVVSLCKENSIFCDVIEIERGKIESFSQKFGGIESAARFLRYEAFENFIHAKNLDFLCLAHNQNDQLETSLMRFLQGSGCDGGGCIAFKRGKFIRPLLDITRLEIEDYLLSKNQKWRTDATNFDENYLRNRIRNSLIPQLDNLFLGWRKSILNGVEKNIDDNFSLEKIAENFQIENGICKNFDFGKSILFPKKSFANLDSSIKRRVIQNSLSKLNFSGRFPYKLIREISFWTDEKKHSLSFENIFICIDSDYLKIEKKEKKIENLEYGFYKIVELKNLKSGEKRKFIFRSFQFGDEIEMKDKKMKSISKIFSEWKVAKSDREKIIIVQDSNSLKNVAILGKKIGYNDWLLSDCEFCFSTGDF